MLGYAVKIHSTPHVDTILLDGVILCLRLRLFRGGADLTCRSLLGFVAPNNFS